MALGTFIRECIAGLTGLAPLLAPGTGLAQNARPSVLVAGIADAKTGMPLKGAELVLLDLRRVARADALGQITIPDIPRGTHRVRVRMMGYAPSDVELAFDADTVGPVFMLERAATTLDTVRVFEERVPAPLRDFEMRRHIGFGRYLTAQQLAKDWGRDFQFTMQSHFAGVRVMQNEERRDVLVSTRGSCGADNHHQGPRSARDRSSHGDGGSMSAAGGTSSLSSCFGGEPCMIQVYLDNIMLNDQDLDLVRTWDLAGVEYYSGTTVPAEYRRSGSACGVILLWSKPAGD